jgi:hypothetical protein
MLPRKFRKLAIGLIRRMRCNPSFTRSILFSIAVILLISLILAAVVARQIAGRCPHCNLPTVYTPGRMSHTCLRCSRIYFLGTEGESTPRRRKYRSAPRRANWQASGDFRQAAERTKRLSGFFENSCRKSATLRIDFLPGRWRQTARNGLSVRAGPPRRVLLVSLSTLSSCLRSLV